MFGRVGSPELGLQLSLLDNQQWSARMEQQQLDDRGTAGSHPAAGALLLCRCLSGGRRLRLRLYRSTAIYVSTLVPDATSTEAWLRWLSTWYYPPFQIMPASRARGPLAARLART
jgi:hypothetical protein